MPKGFGGLTLRMWSRSVAVRNGSSSSRGWLGLCIALILASGLSCSTSDEGGCDPVTDPNCDSNTSTTITSAAPDPSVIGQVVQVNFEVAGGNGTPPGNVEVTVDESGVERCTASASLGNCEIRITTAGSKQIRASYLGGGGFGPSDDTESHQVRRASTVTTVGSHDPDPSFVGQGIDVAFTVSVEDPGGGNPSGNVTVSDGKDSCAAKVREGRCTLIPTTAGVKTLTASYNGDAAFEASFGTADHEVSGAGSTVTVSDSPDPSVVGQPVRVSYEVESEGGNPTGTVEVTVNDGSGDTCTGTVSQGYCDIVLTRAGQPTITATYSGDANFLPGAGSVEHTTERAETETEITGDDPDPSVILQEVVVSYSVSALAPGSGTPTGNVTVSDTVDSCTGTVTEGSCTITFTTAGEKKLTASYAGDGNFRASVDTVDHSVTAAGTIVTVTDVPDPSIVGQPVTVSFEVTSTAGTPTGLVTVTVNDGSGATCSATVQLGECDITLTLAGQKVLTASYAGDGNFEPGSGTAAHTVNRAQTTTTITADTPDPSVTGQPVPVTFSVLVNAPGTGTPTGNVQVSSGTDSCTGTIAQGGCDLILRAAGARTLTATYLGDVNYEGSQDTEPHQVNPALTTVALVTNPNPSAVGQQLTVNFTVSPVAPGTGIPTGTVTVTVNDGSGATCTASTAAGQCNITLNTTGSWTITGTYSGDSNFLTSAGTAGHQVSGAQTVTTITSDTPDPSVVGQVATVAFTVAPKPPATGTPTGTVTISVNDGSGATCSADVSTGQCQLTLNRVGNNWKLTATYLGDSNFLGSSDEENHTVNRAQTTTVINSDSPDPSRVGQPVTVEFSVSVNSPGSGSPTGQVTVQSSDGASCQAPVGDGECDLTFTAAGAKTLTASYSGDTSFQGSQDTEPHTVTQGLTTINITSDDPDASRVGQAVTVAWNLSVSSPAAGNPTGQVTVTVNDGTGATCSAAVGVGQCQITLTTPGSKTLTATYAGDANFQGSSDNESHTVNPGLTTTTITSDSPDPSSVGVAVSVAWTVVVNAPASGTPTGTVTVTVNDGTGATCSAAVGAGQCQITLTTPGVNKILTATYSGDSNFQSSSDTEFHTVTS